jgi:hypothetical protein
MEPTQASLAFRCGPDPLPSPVESSRYVSKMRHPHMITNDTAVHRWRAGWLKAAFDSLKVATPNT